MLRRQLERYGIWLVAIGALMAIALATGSYIVVQQRLSLPWQERYGVKVEFSSTSGLTPGLGQPVNVAGVKVGTVSGTTLRDGRALVNLAIDPAKLPQVRRDARATLVPNTGLKDLQIELYPGRAAQRMPEGGVIPVARTAPPVDADELTSALDQDTREFFQILVGDLDRGLDGRGEDVRELLKALGPTVEQARSLTSALSRRRRELKRLVTNLAVIGRAVEDSDDELGQLVDAAGATLRTLGDQETALRTAVNRLPATLEAARGTLDRTTRFAQELGPTLERLNPIVRKLPAALRATRPLLTEAEPILRTRLRPLVREIQPLAGDLGPLTTDLTTVTPYLSTAFEVLTYTVNTLAYNPSGDNEGYLYWLAWFAHNLASVHSVEDAHGSVIRGMGLIDCTSGTQSAPPEVQAIFGQLPVCP